MEIAAKIYGAPSIVYDRFQEWQRAGFFESMWIAGLLEYDRERGFEWE
jgi:putative transposase